MHLIVENLSFAHPRAARLFQGVHLTARPGEPVAIVGPSGSGKTTLLALIGGLLRPGTGRIAYVDDTGTNHPVGQHTSWVLQTVNVLPDRSVRDNVAVGAFADGAGRDTALAATGSALAAVGLDGKGHRPIRTLSGGEAQRAVIARAAVSARPVLLADEPTGQLDRATSDRVIDTMLSATTGKITVIVTHDPAVAAKCARTMTLTPDGLVPA